MNITSKFEIGSSVEFDMLDLDDSDGFVLVSHRGEVKGASVASFEGMDDVHMTHVQYLKEVVEVPTRELRLVGIC